MPLGEDSTTMDMTLNCRHQLLAAFSHTSSPGLGLCPICQKSGRPLSLKRSTEFLFKPWQNFFFFLVKWLKVEWIKEIKEEERIPEHLKLQFLVTLGVRCVTKQAPLCLHFFSVCSKVKKIKEWALLWDGIWNSVTAIAYIQELETPKVSPLPKLWADFGKKAYLGLFSVIHFPLLCRKKLLFQWLKFC